MRVQLKIQYMERSRRLLFHAGPAFDLRQRLGHLSKLRRRGFLRVGSQYLCLRQQGVQPGVPGTHDPAEVVLVVADARDEDRRRPVARPSCSNTRTTRA